MAWFKRSDLSSYETRQKETVTWLAGRPGRVAGHRSRGISKATRAERKWEAEDRRRFV